MVVAYIRLFTGGAGFVPGVGLYEFNIPPAVPVAAEFALMNDAVSLGRAYLHDNDGIPNCTVCPMMYRVGNQILFLRSTGGDYWRHNIPFTLAQNDRMSAYFVYPTTAV